MLYLLDGTSITILIIICLLLKYGWHSSIQIRFGRLYQQRSLIDCCGLAYVKLLLLLKTDVGNFDTG